jgi:uncharacterized protein
MPVTTALPSRPRHRVAFGATSIAAIVLTTVFAFAGPASAHVKVNGIGVSQGGEGIVTFLVPTESDVLTTTGLTVTLPSDTPIVSVSTQPKAGWTATETTEKLTKPITTDDGIATTYVSSVTWTATSPGAAIPPGQFDTFSLSMGPLPDKATVSFPALQTYSDGSTVNWNEKSADGKTEPEHPAPVLILPASAGAVTAAATGGTTAGSSTTASDGSMVMDSSTAWTGIVGLIAGLLGLIAGAIALYRTRRPAPDRT